jgi:hypothetical protein
MFDWRYYVPCGVAVFFGFVLRFYQDKRRVKKVDVKFQFVASLVLSYVAFLLYRDRKITLCSIEIWLFFWSYFASLAITIADKIFANGFKTILITLAKKYLAYSDEQNKKNDDNIE